MPPAQALVVVIVCLGCSALTTGVVLFLLGWRRLGKLVRHDVSTAAPEVDRRTACEGEDEGANRRARRVVPLRRAPQAHEGLLDEILREPGVVQEVDSKAIDLAPVRRVEGRERLLALPLRSGMREAPHEHFMGLRRTVSGSGYCSDVACSHGERYSVREVGWSKAPAHLE